MCRVALASSMIDRNYYSYCLVTKVCLLIRSSCLRVIKKCLPKPNVTP